MAINYPVPPEARFTIYDTSINSIIARNQRWPRADGMEIEGLANNIVYLQETTDAKPDFDSRLYRLEQNETLDVPNNTATKTWTSVAKGLEERKVAAENKEAQELNNHINLSKEVAHTRLVVTAILNHIGGLQLPAKVTNFVDKYEATGVKLWKNRDRLKTLLDELEAGSDPDLDAGWEIGEYTPQPPIDDFI